MMDLLALGSVGVRAFQAALNITGENVANADTPGYVRREVQLRTIPTGPGGPIEKESFSGAGVRPDGILRSSDALKTNSARIAAGDHARLETRADWLRRLESLAVGAEIGTRMAGLFDAGSDLAAAPTSVAARSLFLGAADQAAAGFRGHADDLERLEADITTATRSAAEEVNGLTRALARVNEELRRTQAGGTTAAGLLDTRDRLLGDLASLVRISVTEGDKGVVSVRLGSGAAAALIVPAVGNPVRIGVQDSAGAGAEIVLDPGHDPTPLRLPASGRLAGLVEAARSVRAARADHDALAGRFAAALNDWHRAGTDALGQPGTPIFATETLKVRAGLANAGTAAVDISLADGASLFPGGYRLIRGASDFTLERSDGSASVSGPGPLILDGITLRLGPGAVPGDAWDLQPASGAAGLSLRPITTAEVAAARRFTVDAGAANSTPALPTVFADPAAAGLIAPPPWTIQITAPGTADILDPAGTVLASVPADGSLIEGPGFRFSLPAGAVGDRFRLALTGAGSADNGHALALAGVRALAGPDGTLEAAQDAAMARMGAALSDTERLAEAAAAVKDDTQRAADLVSGVDLNREAAELTRLQVAYRANAQVIATARALFDTIFGLAA